MNTLLINIVMLVQVVSALIIVGLVLIQHGKGADMGAAFGSGASGSLFGATGSSNFLSKSTGIAAAIFFAATLALSYMSSNRHASVNGGVLDSVSIPAAPATPAASVPPTAPVSPAITPAAPAPATAPAASADQGAKTAPAAPQSNQIPK